MTYPSRNVLYALLSFDLWKSANELLEIALASKGSGIVQQAGVDRREAVSVDCVKQYTAGFSSVGLV